jgi:ParB-like chromosome segregation protein Spo0J
MTEQARDDKQPSYLAHNPWVGILSERGRDNGQPEPVGVRKPTVPETGNQQACLTSSSKKKPNRGIKLLQAALQAYELHLQHFSLEEIAATLGVTSRQVHNYLRKAKAYLGVPEGMKHAALAEIMLAIKHAWMMFYKSEDPRVKVLWFRAALSAQIHRDRLLGLLTDRTVQFEELKQT